ncbi:MAG: ATP-dependent helicase RecG [Patescibacteria group bacterium]|nr:ATP-dependent helicase RecG [Patescibacteria group bacterium]
MYTYICMNIQSQLSTVKGVGPVLASKFSQIGLNTVGDLLDYTPRDYNNYLNAVNIQSMQPGMVTVKGTFDGVKQRRVRRGLHITEADFSDGFSKVRVVWFNQPYRAASIKNQYYIIKGNYGLQGQRLQIVNPLVTASEQDIDQSDSITPIYVERSGLKSFQISKVVKEIFNNNIDVPETLPKSVVNNYKIINRAKAYKSLHLPNSDKEIEQAKQRLAFEELYTVMMAAKKMRQLNKSAPSKPIEFNQTVAQDFVEYLPFVLTPDQKQVAWQILKDMQKTEPMNRLVEGDVGSGKTVVAALATIMALDNGLQVAFVAPTELLARQHYKTIKKLLNHTGHAKNMRLLIGSLKQKHKIDTHKEIKTSKATCIIGTHAILQKNVIWNDLGLVIIDEQHRFGVQQRQSLHATQETMPHILCMTATPIPRSLALTVYGELSISIIAKPPSQKASILTTVVSPNSTAQMYGAIKDQLNKGHQAYIVCPLIEESTMLKVPSAQETYKILSQTELKNYNLGLLHGKLKPDQKEQIMQQFIDKKIDVLVSTTVIEVGVDVPNATEMVILGADRFGLAQLHQIRGRVGRGKHEGHCYLVMTDSQKPTPRMQVMTNTSDGFKLAEYDLKLRGPGAIYGTRQHGEIDLRYVQLTDHKLIAQVRSAVDQSSDILENLIQYPYLAQKIQRALKLTYLN